MIVRRFVVRLLSWISGALLGVVLFFVLQTVMDMLVGETPDNAGVLYAIDALIVVWAWLLLRRRLRGSFVLRSITASATIVAIIAAAGGFVVGSKYGEPRDKTYVSTMKSDLRALVEAQETFKRDSGRYSATPPPGYRTSPGVKDLRIVPTSDGWYATVAHARALRVCIVYTGSTGFPPATREGEPACTGMSSGITDPDFLPWMLVLLIVATIFGGVARLIDRPPPSTST